MYGGTKAEMERLIADAAKLDSSVKANDMSFGNLVKAIHAVQTEMGITGTTMREGTETISGSVASMKAAWSNLVTGFADENADLKVLIDNFFNSVITVVKNVGPRIAVAIQGVSEFIFIAIEEILPQIIDIITEKLPTVIEKGTEIVGSLGAGLIKAIPQLVKESPRLVLAILEGIGLMTAEMVIAGVELVMQLIAGIGSMISPLVQKAKETIKAFGDALKEQIRAAKEWGADLISNFINGIKSKIGELTNSVKGVAKTVWNYLHFSEPEMGPLSDFHTYAPDMIDMFVKGIDKNAYKIGEHMNRSLDFGVETVPFEKTAYGAATAATVNALSTGATSENVNGMINLMVPDGKVLASWLFNNLIDVAKSNGTPITAM